MKTTLTNPIGETWAYLSRNNYVKCLYCGEVFDPNGADQITTLLPRRLDLKLSFWDVQKVDFTCTTCGHILGEDKGTSFERFSGYSIWDNGDKIKLSWISTKQGITDRFRTIQSYGSTYKCGVILNTKSKQAYLLPKVDINTGKRTGGIRNISYLNTKENIYSMSPIAINEFGNLLMEKIGLKLKFESLSDLVLINRYRIETVDDLRKINRLLKYMPMEAKRIYNHEDIMVKSGFTKASKPVKKLMVDSSILMTVHSYCSKIVTKADNQLKLYNAIIAKFSQEEEEYGTEYSSSSHNMKDAWEMVLESGHLRKIIEFVALFEEETIGVNKILKALNKDSNMYMILDDTIFMAKEILKANMSIAQYLRGDVKEIHDRMSIGYNAIGKDNLLIPYEKEEIKNECKIGDYSFALVKDTDELRFIGSTMNICVGSYDLSVIRKSCTIYYVINNKKLIACIEVTKNGIMQVKGSSNNLLTGIHADTVRQWIDMNDISIYYKRDLEMEEYCPQEVSYDIERVILEELRPYANANGEAIDLEDSNNLVIENFIPLEDRNLAEVF